MRRFLLKRAFNLSISFSSSIDFILLPLLLSAAVEVAFCLLLFVVGDNGVDVVLVGLLVDADDAVVNDEFAAVLPVEGLAAVVVAVVVVVLLLLFVAKDA